MEKMAVMVLVMAQSHLAVAVAGAVDLLLLLITMAHFQHRPLKGLEEPML
jgi:uncharacterized membrane protein